MVRKSVIRSLGDGGKVLLVHLAQVIHQRAEAPVFLFQEHDHVVFLGKGGGSVKQGIVCLYRSPYVIVGMALVHVVEHLAGLLVVLGGPCLVTADGCVNLQEGHIVQ